MDLKDTTEHTAYVQMDLKITQAKDSISSAAQRLPTGQLGGQDGGSKASCHIQSDLGISFEPLDSSTDGMLRKTMTLSLVLTCLTPCTETDLR